MGSEAIIIPIIVDPKQGVAGLAEVGKQAEKTGQQMDQGSAGAFKFSDSMKKMGANLLQALGVMKLADAATKVLVNSMMEWLSGANKMVSAQKLLKKAHEEAVASTQKEVVELQTLFAVAKNTELSYVQRQEAINRINKAYPELHRNLTLEKIGTQEVADAIDNVINNLVKKAELDAIISQIATLSNGIRDAQNAMTGLPRGVLKNAFKQFAEESSTQIKLLKEEAEKLQADTILGNSEFGKSFGNAAGKNLNIKPSKLTIKPIKVEVDLLGIGAYKLELPTIFDTSNADNRSRFKKQLDDLTQLMNTGSAFKIPGEPGKGMQSGFDQVNRQLEDRKRSLEEMIALNQQMGNLVADFVTPAFENMFDAIFSNEDPMKAFFKTIGESIKQLLGQLVAAAIRAAALSIFTGGAASGGLSFGQAFKKVFGFASGGLVTGPVSALVGEGMGTSRSNPEVVAPLDKLQSFFQNMISGQQGFSAANMGLAGSILNLPNRVEIVGRGRDFYGIMELHRQSLGRTA